MFTCKCFEEHRWEAILCSFITRQLTFPRLLNPSLGFLRPSLLKFWGPSLCQGNLVNSEKPYHKLHRISMKKSQCELKGNQSQSSQNVYALYSNLSFEAV